MALVIEAQASPSATSPIMSPSIGTKMTANFCAFPTLDEVPYPVKMEPNLVVEFYSR